MVRVFYSFIELILISEGTNRIEELPMSQASKAIQGVKNGKARYRYVLTQDLE